MWNAFFLFPETRFLTLWYLSAYRSCVHAVFLSCAETDGPHKGWRTPAAGSGAHPCPDPSEAACVFAYDPMFSCFLLVTSAYMIHRRMGSKAYLRIRPVCHYFQHFLSFFHHLLSIATWFWGPFAPRVRWFRFSKQKLRHILASQHAWMSELNTWF